MGEELAGVVRDDVARFSLRGSHAIADAGVYSDGRAGDGAWDWSKCCVVHGSAIGSVEAVAVP